MSATHHRPRGLRLAALAVALAGGVSSPLPGSAAAAADPIVGTWQQVDEDGDVGALVTITMERGLVSGHIVRLVQGPGEPENPTCDACRGALHGRPLVGLPIIRGLKPEGRHYSAGHILDPESGEDYDLQADLAPDGQTLAIRAYRGVALLGRSQTWRRAP